MRLKRITWNDVIEPVTGLNCRRDDRRLTAVDAAAAAAVSIAVTVGVMWRHGESV